MPDPGHRSADHHHDDGSPMSALLLTLASEGGPKTLWNPTILGILVALCAVGLFCG